MSIYTDPTVSYIMRNLADGLAEFNAKAEAALSQSTQSLAVPSESAASEPTAGECLSPLLPASPAVTNSKAIIGWSLCAVAYGFAMTCAWAFFTVPT